MDLLLLQALSAEAAKYLGAGIAIGVGGHRTRRGYWYPGVGRHERHWPKPRSSRFDYYQYDPRDRLRRGSGYLRFDRCGNPVVRGLI